MFKLVCDRCGKDFPQEDLRINRKIDDPRGDFCKPCWAVQKAELIVHRAAEMLEDVRDVPIHPGILAAVHGLLDSLKPTRNIHCAGCGYACARCTSAEGKVHRGDSGTPECINAAHDQGRCEAQAAAYFGQIGSQKVTLANPKDARNFEVGMVFRVVAVDMIAGTLGIEQPT